jgi:hypothetical protein
VRFVTLRILATSFFGLRTCVIWTTDFVATLARSCILMEFDKK